MPAPQVAELFKEPTFPDPVIIDFFLCLRPGHTAIIDHAPPDALFDLGEMPLDTIMSHVIALNPNGPQNRGTKKHPKATNHPKAPRDTIRKNALFPIDGSPSPVAPGTIRKCFDDGHTPIPSISGHLTLPKAVKNRFPGPGMTHRAVLHDISVNNASPGINLHSSVPHTPHQASLLLDTALVPNSGPSKPKALRQDTPPLTFHHIGEHMSRSKPFPTQLCGVKHERDIAWPLEPVGVPLQLVSPPIIEVSNSLLGAAGDGSNPNSPQGTKKTGIRLSQVNGSSPKSRLIRNLAQAARRSHDDE
jgi:hypothetical protein